MAALALCPLAAALLAAGPVSDRGVAAMRVPPLPPAWTATSEATAHAADDLPAGFALGDRKVRAGADRAGIACLQELRRLGVPFRREPPTRGIETPVVVTGPVRGLKLTPKWGRKPALMDCRFALTLYRIAPVVLASGVNELLYSSFYSYRNVARTRWLSRHAFGLAVDVFEIRGPGGFQAEVKRDWVKVIGRPGDCVGGVASPRARVLRRLACNLERSGLVHLVLTPDSDYAHRDHYHISGFREAEGKAARLRYAGRIKGQTYIPRRVQRATVWRRRPRPRGASHPRRPPRARPAVAPARRP